MRLGLSEGLSGLVARRFAAAKESGALIFSKTEVTTIRLHNVPFQLRYCPALSKKPTASPQPTVDQPPAPKPNPFLHPSPELTIADLPHPQACTHRLVLNKFPVIGNHFLLVTKSFKPQTDILESDDLETAYSCLKAWEEEGADPRTPRRLFAFFNSGDDSGASQPHRHLQFLPVEEMIVQENQGWELLIDELAKVPPVPGSEYRQMPTLPFAHFAVPLPSDPSAEALQEIYLSLYKMAVKATGHNRADAIATRGASAISYNLAMTRSIMMICPRRRETSWIPVDAKANADVAHAGQVSLNGTILAGTLMVKAEAEWDELRKEPANLGNMLRDVGFPPAKL